MAKKLIVKNPEKCNGCELCVVRAQMEAKRVGLEGSPVRILRDTTVNKFTPDLDPTIQQLRIEKIKKWCPMEVFEIEENET